MTQNDTVPEPRHMQSHRSGASRKLLSRKPGDKAMAAQDEALEDVFPDGGSSETAEHAIGSPAAGTSGKENSLDPAILATGAALAGPDQLAAEDASEVPIEAHANTSAAGLSWSEEDEQAFSTMAARRKASGYQRRGRDMRGQFLRVGGIMLNPGTVVATIVELFNTRRAMARQSCWKRSQALLLATPRQSRPIVHGRTAMSPGPFAMGSSPSLPQTKHV